MTTIRSVCLVSMLASFSLSAAQAPKSPIPESQPSAYNVSVVQLIANQKAYSGKVVRAIGFCHLEFEGNGLYLHKEDFDRANSRNAIWLDVPEGKQALSDQWVLIEGTFEDADNEFEAGFSGRLTKISRMERWPSREEFRSRLIKK